MNDIAPEEGLFPLEEDDMFYPCPDPRHAFPTHIWIPIGYGYTHVCPTCGNAITQKNKRTNFYEFVQGKESLIDDGVSQ